MNELGICDHFKWTLDYVRELKIKDYLGVIKYINKLGAEQKKAIRKAKRR